MTDDDISVEHRTRADLATDYWRAVTALQADVMLSDVERRRLLDYLRHVIRRAQSDRNTPPW